MGQVQVKINYFLISQCNKSDADYDKQIEALLRKKRELQEIKNREMDRAAREGGIPVPDRRSDKKSERRITEDRRCHEK